MVYVCQCWVINYLGNNQIFFHKHVADEFRPNLFDYILFDYILLINQPYYAKSSINI